MGSRERLQNKGPKPIPVELRFWTKVDLPEDLELCWKWLGGQSSGYGRFSIDSSLVANRKQVPAHRFAYEYFHGPLAKDLVLHHICKNTLCVNPKHLQPLSIKEHVAQSISVGVMVAALQSVKTHCPKGHPYEGSNLSIRRDGSRVCRECKRQRYNEWRKRNLTKRAETQRAYYQRKVRGDSMKSRRARSRSIHRCDDVTTRYAHSTAQLAKVSRVSWRNPAQFTCSIPDDARKLRIDVEPVSTDDKSLLKRD